ncbi:hypothetical protein ACQ4LE_010081 [Meloidogyne hapla]
MFGTAWLALTLAKFRKTKFFGKFFWFGAVSGNFNLDENTLKFNFGNFWMLPLTGHLLCCCSLVFYLV